MTRAPGQERAFRSEKEYILHWPGCPALALFNWELNPRDTRHIYFWAAPKTRGCSGPAVEGRKTRGVGKHAPIERHVQGMPRRIRTADHRAGWLSHCFTF